MRKTFTLLTMPCALAGLLALATAGGVRAQAAPGAPTAPAAGPRATAAGRTLSLSTSDKPLKSVLENLAEQSGQRILLGPEATGRLTMTISNVSLEKMLSISTKVSANRWSRITLPAERAKSLTAEQAQALVSAAEAVAPPAASTDEEGPAVSLSLNPDATDLVTVYLVHIKGDPAAIRAAREEAKKKAEGTDVKNPAVAAGMSEDARKDPNVVNAFSALQLLSPNQVAMLTREYLLHSTPEQRQAIGDAFAQQRDQFREAMQRREQQQ